MFGRVSAVFRSYILHIFEVADGLRLARDTTNANAAAAIVVVSRVDVSRIHGHAVGVVAGVHGRRPPGAAVTDTVHASVRIVAVAETHIFWFT